MLSLIRPLALLTAFVIGFSLPVLHQWGWGNLVPWLIRAMLLIVFLQLRFSQMKFRRSHFRILLVNLLIGLLGWSIFYLFGHPYWGLAAFFVGISPTGTATAAVVSLLKGNVEYTVTAFLICTFGVTICLPLFLPGLIQMSGPSPYVLGTAINGETSEILNGAVSAINSWQLFQDIALQVASLTIGPFVLAMLLRLIYPKIVELPKRLRNFSFGLWVFSITLILSNASFYLREHDVPWSVLLEMALISFVVCFLNFYLGYLLGEKGFKHESSQSLGQKNTTICIIIATACVDPVIALAPTFYIVWHNLWNAWQMQMLARKEVAEKNVCKKTSKIDV